MKLLVTGGHLTPAYAFCQYALKHGNTIHYVAHQPETSIEAIEITQLGVPYIHLPTVKFDRYQKLKSLLRSPSIIKAIIKSYQIINKCKPECIITFGSFNAVPVAIAAKLLKIPIIIHEQTRTVGLANRFISKIAAACAVSYKDSNLDHSNVTVTGNLIREEMWQPIETSPFPLKSQKPILFITCGNQGSKVINEVVSSLYTELTTKYQLIWQTGKSSTNISSNDSIQKEWFSSQESSWILNHAHISICRGGANTTAELMVTGAIAIIIPLPNSSADEQMKNATYLEQRGSAIVIPQSELSSQRLLDALNFIELKYDSMKNNASLLKNDQNSSAIETFYEIVKTTALHHS